jgi:M6 family metalloprotease domain
MAIIAQLKPILMRRISITLVLVFSAAFAAAQQRTTLKTAVIPVQFQNVRFPSADDVQMRLDSVFNQASYSAYGATGSVNDYFLDNLGDKYGLTFRVFKPVTLPFDNTYYSGSGQSEAVGVALIQHTVSAALQAGCSFNDFDGDQDGYIDNVYIIFAGYGDPNGGPSVTIWPHSRNVSSKKIKAGDLKVGMYCCSPYFNGLSGSKLTSIGLLCHEEGHALGLKDMYDMNGDTEGKAEGLWGTLSLMDKGNYNNDGRTPPYLNSVEREMLGIADIKEISSPGNYYLPPLDVSGKAFKIATSDPDEYFLLEYRSPRGWDRYIGGGGLLVYHVDKSPNQAGSMTATERWMVNAVNSCEEHQCVDLLEAANDTSIGVSGVFFPGSTGVYDLFSTSKAPLLSWNKQGPMLCLRDIGVVAGMLVFTLAVDHLWLEPKMESYHITPYQTDASLKWKTASEMPGEWIVAWKAYGDDIWQSSEPSKSLEYSFTSLNPGTIYDCKLSYTYLNVSFDVLEFPFSTVQVTSKYPAIAGIPKVCCVGDSLVLRVFNVNENVRSISWEINGSAYYEETYPLTYSGLVSMAVTLKYSDNSTERITRNLTVKQKDIKESVR